MTGVGDEGFTLGAFGANTQATVVITDNTLKTSGAKGTAPGEDGSTDGIAVTFQDNVSDGDFTASGVYDFTITGNTIEADTDNVAGTLERGDKAEGIKFTINEGVKNGTTKLTAVIDDNDIKTRIGDGIEFAVNEKAVLSMSTLSYEPYLVPFIFCLQFSLQFSLQLVFLPLLQ